MRACVVTVLMVILTGCAASPTATPSASPTASVDPNMVQAGQLKLTVPDHTKSTISTTGTGLGQRDEVWFWAPSTLAAPQVPAGVFVTSKDQDGGRQWYICRGAGCPSPGSSASVPPTPTPSATATSSAIPSTAPNSLGTVTIHTPEPTPTPSPAAVVTLAQ